MIPQLRVLLIHASVFGLMTCHSYGQLSLPQGLTGNFQSDVQYYSPDTIINAPVVPEKIMATSFLNLNYVSGGFSAGMRYESNLNPLLGIDKRWSGNGIRYRYLSFARKNLSVTAGAFYEQFGNGLIFRSYEERSLGIDNMMDGIRIRYVAGKALEVKGFAGKQRFFFAESAGIIRGLDAELNVNEISSRWSGLKTRLTLGASAISRFQEDDNPRYKLPQNVGAFAGRFALIRGNASITGEYAWKGMDPSELNGYIYRNGHAMFLSASYSQKGLGVNVSVKRIDNMNFRADRSATGNLLMVNYLPALTRQHTYMHAAFYPYATQPNGEAAIQAELIYTFSRQSRLKGLQVVLNASAANSIDTVATGDDYGYRTTATGIGKQIYFRDYNIEIRHKFSQKLKLNLAYLNQVYNKDVIQGLKGFGSFHIQTGIAEVTYQPAKTRSFRTELQHISLKEDMGNWALALVEIGLVPNWLISVYDNYNYGNPKAGNRAHYYNAMLTYSQASLRVSLGYGRQREGILCVGGVCRNVPASNGIQFSVSGTF